MLLYEPTCLYVNVSHLEALRGSRLQKVHVGDSRLQEVIKGKTECEAVLTRSCELGGNHACPHFAAPVGSRSCATPWHPPQVSNFFIMASP